MKTVAIAFLVAALTTPALAADPEPQGQEQAKPKKPRKICKYDERSHSRIAKRICKTPEEWEVTRLDDDFDRLDTIDRGQALTPGGPR